MGFVTCSLGMYGLCKAWVCVCVGFLMCGCMYVWIL